MRQLVQFFLGFTLLFIFQQSMYAQVGIGTTIPDASSILDITSNSQGMLTPRMTTAQRTGIASPAEGLLVFDIDEDAFYYFDSAVWVKLEGSVTRDNYKLIKSDADLADELAAGGGTKYLLTPNYLYEINGEITLAAPIDLNNAYIIGEDTNEDKLVRVGGTLFEGSRGGSIRSITLIAPGGTVFNLTGTPAENLIFRDCVVVNSGSVGSISSFNLVFISIVQYVNNAAGITYTDINQLLINNEGWDHTNGGTYQTFIGEFRILAKQGGFSELTTATAAMDVTGITNIIGSAGIHNVDFYGAANFITGASPYTGYNFTRDWDVNSPGIPVETDGVATGDINFEATVGSGTPIAFTGTGTSSRKKISGSTDSNSLFRFAKDGDNRITYEGKKTRYFGITASLSFQGDSNNTIFIFYLAKNGSVLEQTKVYRENGANNDVGAAAVVGTVQLSPGDYVELWAERYSGGGGLIMVSLNLIAR